MSCLSCARGLCEECHIAETECCLGSLQAEETNKERRWLPDEQVKDPRSTMRKRAQKVLADERDITIGSPCEWRGKADVGGGRHPIVGCVDGVVSHIHHGPDKNWYHNTPDNLHGICHTCHNRWHSRNDNCYDPTLPHNPRDATLEELEEWAQKMPKISHKDCDSNAVHELQHLTGNMPDDG